MNVRKIRLNGLESECEEYHENPDNILRVDYLVNIDKFAITYNNGTRRYVRCKK